MKLPSPVAPGNQVRASDYNSLLLFVKSLQLSGGPGTRVSRTAAGTTISVLESGAGDSGSSIIFHPFKVSDGSTSTAAQVLVRTGSVNDVIPTGISPTAQALSSAGTWRVYLDCTLNGAGTITAVAVGVVNGAQPTDSDTHAYITLATVTVVALDGGSGFAVSDIEQLVTHSLRFFACGRATSGESITTRGTYNFWGI